MTSTEYTDLVGLIVVEKDQDTLKKVVQVARSRISVLKRTKSLVELGLLHSPKEIERLLSR